MALELSSELLGREQAGSAKARRDVVDLSALDGLIGFNIHIVDLLAFQQFYERFEKEAMTPGIFSTLIAIKANPGIRQGALADALMIQRSNMTMLINRLIRAGYVKRQGAKGDNRGVVLTLAEEGDELLRRIRGKVAAHEKAIGSGLTARERATCLRLLQKLATHLRAAPRRSANGRVTPG